MVGSNFVRILIFIFQTETCSETKLEVPKVLHYLREVTNKPTMMDENSVLLFNAGAHYVKVEMYCYNVLQVFEIRTCKI